MALPDTFTATNGTLLQTYDSTWVRHSSYSVDCDIQSNRLKVKAGGNSGYYYNQSPSSADYDVSATFNYSATSGIQGGVTGRMQSGANTFYHARLSSGPNVEQLKFVAGTATQIGSAVASGIATNTDATLTLSMAGTTIRTLINGVQKVSATDNAITSTGFPGVRFVSGSSSITLDDFTSTGMLTNRTLTASAGSFALSGVAASLWRSRRLPSDADAIALSGNAAAVSTTRSLVAAAGSVAVAGMDAGASAGRRLQAAVGSIDLTGYSAGLVYEEAGSYILAGNPGDFSAAAQAAGIRVERILAPAAGSVTMAGRAAALEYRTGNEEYAPDLLSAPAKTTMLTVEPSRVIMRVPASRCVID